MSMPNYNHAASYNNIKVDNILIKITSSIRKTYEVIEDFLTHRNKQIMFMFGPSGCGKQLLINQVLTYSHIPFEFVQPKIEED